VGYVNLSTFNLGGGRLVSLSRDTRLKTIHLPFTLRWLTINYARVLYALLSHKG
jgi:hypothetical protein